MATTPINQVLYERLERALRAAIFSRLSPPCIRREFLNASSEERLECRLERVITIAHDRRITY